MKNKKTTNPVNVNVKCFWYAATVALNQEENRKHSQSISKVKSFTNKYNRKEINCPPRKDDWKRFEKKIKQLLFMDYMLKKWIYILHNRAISKHNLSHENCIILLMIPNGEGWHYCAVKRLALLRGIASNYNGKLIIWIAFIHLERNTLESHKKVCENKDFSCVVIPFEDTKILEFNQHQQSDKTQYIICPDLECIIKKLDGYGNNPEKSSTAQIAEHFYCKYSISTIWTFDVIENQHDIYRGGDGMKKFCEFLTVHAMKIINFEKRKRYY